MSDSATSRETGWPTPFEPAIKGARPPHPDGSHPGQGYELTPDDLTDPDEATIIPRDPENIATEWITASIHDFIGYESLEEERVAPYEADDRPTVFLFSRNGGQHVEFVEGGSANGRGIIASTADTVEVTR